MSVEMSESFVKYHIRGNNIILGSRLEIESVLHFDLYHGHAFAWIFV